MTSAAIDPRLSPVRWLLRALARLVFGSAMRLDIEGRQHYPATGPYIIAMNHLHFLDMPVFFASARHQFAGLAAAHWVRHRAVGPLIRLGADLIPVGNERLDTKALAAAVRWLGQGGVLLVAPEGTRNPNGLARGRPGVAYLASRSRAPVVPVAVWGQERWRSLLHLERPRVCVRIGPPFLPADLGERPRGDDLEAATEAIMHAIAAMLPPAYQGVYRSE